MPYSVMCIIGKCEEMDEMYGRVLGLSKNIFLFSEIISHFLDNKSNF